MWLYRGEFLFQGLLVLASKGMTNTVNLEVVWFGTALDNTDKNLHYKVS